LHLLAISLFCISDSWKDVSTVSVSISTNLSRTTTTTTPGKVMNNSVNLRTLIEKLIEDVFGEQPSSSFVLDEAYLLLKLHTASRTWKYVASIVAKQRNLVPCCEETIKFQGFPFCSEVESSMNYDDIELSTIEDIVYDATNGSTSKPRKHLQEVEALLQKGLFGCKQLFLGSQYQPSSSLMTLFGGENFDNVHDSISSLCSIANLILKTCDYIVSSTKAANSIQRHGPTVVSTLKSILIDLRVIWQMAVYSLAESLFDRLSKGATNLDKENERIFTPMAAACMTTQLDYFSSLRSLFPSPHRCKYVKGS
jgi:hypothetical protein